MNAQKDIFGRTEKQARSIFGEHHASSTIALIGGVWVARWMQKNMGRTAWKLYPNFAAINRNGQVVANESRRSTVRLARGEKE